MINQEEVKLEDMIWAEKLAKVNRSAAEMLRKARRKAQNPDMVEGGMDDFMNQLDLGDPDPRNHRTRFESADDIAEWFRQDKSDDWRQRD
jgi:heme-degrading monooxygenase HmoA